MKCGPTYLGIQSERSYRAFFHSIDWKNPFAVTLTPRQVLFQDKRSYRLTEEELRQNTRHFLNRLRKRFFGNKRSVDFQRLIFVEHQPILHLHCVIDVPDFVADASIQQIVLDEWFRTRWGTQNVHVVPCITSGWTSYIMKRRSKDRVMSDCFDFDNSKFETINKDAGAGVARK